MADTSIPGRKPGLFTTLRNDNWWVSPLLIFLGFSAFIVYSTWAALQAGHYHFGSYLSPMYSPLMFDPGGAAGGIPTGHHAWWPGFPEWLKTILPAGSPAFVILAFPGLFRFTCYYYRGAYYKAFAATPPNCYVGGAKQSKFRGETFLLIFQNLHRYALYFAIIFIFILSYDAIIAWINTGFGLGCLVLTINPILLGMYTFGCHSWRHLIGGRKDCFSCAGSGFVNGVYHKVSWLNRNHKLFAWCSLFWVGFSDLYVRMASMGKLDFLGNLI